MRRAVLVGLVLVLGCPAPPPPSARECEPGVDVPTGIRAPVGTLSDVTVRFFNPTSKAATVTGLELSNTEAFSFQTAPGSFTVEPGSCEAPGSAEVVLQFAPTNPGAQQGRLTGDFNGRPLSVELSAIGTGPLLAEVGLVNFGATGLTPSVSRPLALRNVGTVDTSVEVSVESIVAANSATAPEELCIGRFEARRCVAANTVTLRRDAAFPLVVVPASIGAKAWDVVLRAAGKRVTARVIANVVDTTDCQLLASPSQVDFGFVQLPVRASRSLTLRSTGPGPCAVTSARTSDRQFRVVDLPSTGQLLPPGGELRVGLEVALLQARSSTATLTFELAPSRSGQPSFLEVSLTASNRSECLVASPAALGFSQTFAECSSSQTISFINTCVDPIFLGAATTDPPFRISDGLPREGVWLANGAALVVRVHFEPSSSTSAQVMGVLRLTGGLTRALALIGTTVPKPLQTERFRPDARVVVDVVLVLDDSPSFVRQHANTRVELDRFARYITRDNPSVNSRVAVTTTDVSPTGPQGRFRATDAGQRWAAGDDLAFNETFAALSQLTTTGAEHQSCIEAAARAVTGPLARDGGVNQGFHRADATLSLICVTDDVENAADPGLWRVALQDAGSRLNFSVIGPIGSTCPVDALDVDGGHLANVLALDGMAGDICRPWEMYGLTGPSLPRTSFFLTGTPQPASVRVALGGVDLPRSSNGRTNWTYDVASNAVRFSSDALGLDPPLIEVSYFPACPAR